MFYGWQEGGGEGGVVMTKCDSYFFQRKYNKWLREEVVLRFFF